MNFNLGLTFSGLIYTILVSIIFFRKKRIKNFETGVFGWLIIITILELVSGCLGVYTITNIDKMPIINKIVNLLYLITLDGWIIIFTLYVLTIPYEMAIKRKIKNTIVIIYSVVSLVIISLPINYINRDGIIYSEGYGVRFAYLIAIICVVSILISSIKNFRNLLNKKYIPMFIFLSFGTLALMLQIINPELFLVSPLEVLVTITMYFTIENPDMKLLTEMHEAKEISDNTNEEKTLFLYNMTQEIRATTKNIDAEADIIIDSDDIDTDKESARNIKGETSKFRMMTNDILDVSAIDSSKVKIYNTSYSLKMLLRTIISSYNEICKNKNIEFRTNIDHNIPESLYGDNINLKKVLKELLDYSVKSTSKGYIELNINTIIKNDIARLIITIEDSSMGIKSSVLERITIDNKVFSSVYKLITLMNGTMVITSNYGMGNKIKIILDQKIEPSTSIEEKKYQSILDNKKILIIDNTESTIKVIEKLLKGSSIDIDYSLNGKDAYNKIKTRNRYDLILLDEELSMMTGVELLNYLKKIRNFNIPVILLSKDNKYEYNEEYLNMGFTDILIKPIKKTPLLECINKNIINREDVLTKNKETK